LSKFKPKNCEVCGTEFIPTGPAARYCKECAKVKHKEAQKRGQRRYRKRKGEPVGVGKGGSNLKGEEHPQYKNGMGKLTRLRSKMKKEINRCEHCGKDLSEVTQYEWCVHHKDHDRTHNERDNLILLCKRCHQIEHECWEAFEGATTSSKERRDEDVSKKAATRNS
jgi:hypothetical protein